MKKTILLAFSLLSCFNFNAQNQIFGMTGDGGAYSSGTIFKTDNNGDNKTVEKDLFKIDAYSPEASAFTEGNDGMLYAVADGGIGSSGTLFQYNPSTGAYTKKIDFYTTTGYSPNGTLCKASDGKLYGMTTQGGANGFGTLYQYDPATNALTIKIELDGATQGSYPRGSLIQLPNGMLYGLTNQGGANGYGTVFQYDPVNNVLTKKADFDQAATGSYPEGSLMQGTDGMLYGMTGSGGLNGEGVLFQFDPVTNGLTNKVDFDGATNGRDPYGSLIQAGNGLIYGMTNRGGANDYGVLFEYNSVSGILTPKYSFDYTSGIEPYGDLMQAADGKLYGLLNTGGSNGYGTLIQYDILTAAVTVKYSLDEASGGEPYGSLMQASNGKLYGMTNSYGAFDNGTVFEFDPVSLVFANKIDFWQAAGGERPKGTPVKANDGFLYGMTEIGGQYDMGVIFRYDPSSKTYQVMHNFTGTDGKEPNSALIQASNGLLYGTTYNGGTANKGVLFSFDPVAQNYTKLLDFNGTANGANPMAALYQATDGMLYGTTYLGGANNKGTLFQYNISSNVLVTKHHFAETDGKMPCGLLVQASDGMLYGTTMYGGPATPMWYIGWGVLYQFDPVSDNFNVIIDLNTANIGNSCMAGLTKAADGHLYGVTITGGAYDNGTIFQYNIATQTATLKFSMDGSNTGRYPSGALLSASNGKLYGMTEVGGANGMGTLFQYDPVADNFVKKNDLDYPGGGSPALNSLVEITLSLATNTIAANQCLGSELLLPYSISGAFNNGNVLNVELSDASGSFASPVVIGSGPVSVTRTLSVAIPANTPVGNGYRIRVVSTDPVIVANDNGSDIAINALPFVTVNSGTICSGQSFTMAPGGASTYTYSGGSAIVSPSANAQYTVTGTDVNGCRNNATSTVTVNGLPTIMATTNNTLLCAGETATLSATGAVSYTWSTAETTSDIVISPTAQTTYTVEGIDANGCSNTSAITQDVSLCTGISTAAMASEASLRLYPNPTNGVLNIDLKEGNDHAVIEITDIAGKVVLSETVSTQQSVIDVQHLNNGIYFVKVSLQNKHQTIKLVKQN